MSNLINPGFWLVALLLALGLFGGGYAAGSKHASSACIAKKFESQQAAQIKAEEKTARREAVAQQRETSREHIRVVYRYLKEKADETPATDCGLDADGLRLWNAANSGTAEAVRSEPDYRLSSAASGVDWPSGGAAAKSHRGDGAIQTMPRSDEQAAGVPE